MLYCYNRQYDFKCPYVLALSKVDSCIFILQLPKVSGPSTCSCKWTTSRRLCCYIRLHARGNMRWECFQYPYESLVKIPFIINTWQVDTLVPTDYQRKMTRLFCLWIFKIHFRRVMVLHTGTHRRAVLRYEVNCHQHKQRNDVLQWLPNTQRVSLLHAQYLCSEVFQYVCW